jgi:hypothetical protein
MSQAKDEQLAIHIALGAVLIVLVLMVVVPVVDQYVTRLRYSRVRDTKIIIRRVERTIDRYQMEHSDACPPSIQALADEQYLARPPRDAWGQPFKFICPGLHTPDAADVISAGADGRFGTADDIKSCDL